MNTQHNHKVHNLPWFVQEKIIEHVKKEPNKKDQASIRLLLTFFKTQDIEVFDATRRRLRSFFNANQLRILFNLAKLVSNHFMEDWEMSKGQIAQDPAIQDKKNKFIWIIDHKFNLKNIQLFYYKFFKHVK